MSEQHKLLTIDGGGIRGVLALEILAELERQLAEAQGIPRDKFRLSDFFDYVAGTSTGAVVAACIACGMRVSDIMDFYTNVGPKMFDNRLYMKIWSWIRYQSAYNSTPLATALKEMFGDRTTLEPGHLKCLFMAVTRNQTTDSPWPISSNPHAKYNDQSLPDCNLKIKLWQITRASTAAPLAYRPETISWDKNNPDEKFLFVDGGVTPYNNPAWLLYRMATESGYNLNWQTGEDKLLVISVGTGSSSKGDDNVLRSATGLRRLISSKKIPGALIQGMMIDQDTNCRQVGRCVYGAELDSEVGDMIPRDADGGKIPLSQDLGRNFLYARYNVLLEQDVLDALGLNDVLAKNVRELGSVDHVGDLAKVGKRIAKDVRVEDFAPFLHRAP